MAIKEVVDRQQQQQQQAAKQREFALINQKRSQLVWPRATRGGKGVKEGRGEWSVERGGVASCAVACKRVGMCQISLGKAQ